MTLMFSGVALLYVFPRTGSATRLSSALERGVVNHAGLPALRVLVSSGEPLTLRLLRQLDRVLPSSPAQTMIMNLYGSTEVAADCTSFDARHWLHYPAEVNGEWSGMPGHLGDAGQYAACHLPEDGRAAPGDYPTAGSRSTWEPTPCFPTVIQKSSSRVASEEGFGHVPAGTPIDDLAVFIAVPLRSEEEKHPCSVEKGFLLAGSFRILAPGELGEVCVAGVAVADGYHW